MLRHRTPANRQLRQMSNQCRHVNPSRKGRHVVFGVRVAYDRVRTNLHLYWFCIVFIRLLWSIVLDRNPGSFLRWFDFPCAHIFIHSKHFFFLNLESLYENGRFGGIFSKIFYDLHNSFFIFHIFIECLSIWDLFKSRYEKILKLGKIDRKFWLQKSW